MSNAVQLAVGAYLSGVNRIINGAMAIQQRPALIVGSGVVAYGQVDRFRMSNNVSAGAYTFFGSPALPDENGISKPFLTAQVNMNGAVFTGANALQTFQQFIEGYNCYDLIGKEVTLSFTFRANTAGTYAVALRDGTSSQSCVQTFTVAAQVSQRIIITFPPIPAAASIPISNAAGLVVSIASLNTGTFQAASAGTWLAGNFITVAGLTNWTINPAGAVSITDVQLESGPIATPFQRRSVGEELLLCQRYFNSVSFRVDIPASTASSFGSVNIEYPATMRANPTNSIVGATFSGSASAGTFNSFQSASAAAVAPTYTAQSTWGAVAATLQNSAEL